MALSMVASKVALLVHWMVAVWVIQMEYGKADMKVVLKAKL